MNLHRRKPASCTRQAAQRLLSLLIFAAVAGCETAAEPFVAPMSPAVAPFFGMIERSFIGLAEAMPEEDFDFKPTAGEFEDVRTFAEQVKHVACANFAFFAETEGKEPPSDCASGGPNPASTKAELLKYLTESFEYGRGVLEGMTSANALDSTSGPYGGESTRLGLATLAVWHASDHYGQLVVYLRMNGLVPPASQLTSPD